MTMNHSLHISFKPSKPESDKIFRRSYRIAISIIISLLIINQLIIHYNIAQQEDNSRVINIAGRQRMLSQKITKICLQISQNSNDELLFTNLQNTLGLWIQSQEILQNGNDEMGINPINNPKILENFQKIEPHYVAIKEACQIILTQHKLSNSAFTQIKENEGEFLRIMNDITFQLDNQAKSQVKTLRNIEIGLSLLAFLTIALEVYFVFRPAYFSLKKYLRKSQTQKEKMTALNQELGSKNDELLTQQEELSQQLEELVATQQMLEQANSELMETNDKLKTNESFIIKAHHKLEQKKNKLIEQNEVLQKAQKTIRDKNKELANKNSLLEENNQVMDRIFERLMTKEKQLQEKNNALQESYQQLAENEQAINNSFQLVMTAKQELEETYRNLDHKMEQISLSIQYASHIQQAIFPPHEELGCYFSDYFVFFRPLDVVSGDFYWSVQYEDYIYLALVDCTGHGVPGALLSMMGHAALNSILFEKKITNPNQMLSMLNNIILENLRPKNSQIYDGMDLGIFRMKKQSSGNFQVEFSGSKTDLWVAQNQEISILKGDRHIIGGYYREEPLVFNLHSITLSEGDRLYMSSDGIKDVPNAKRKKFGVRRMIQFLEDHQHLSLADQQERLEQILEAFCENEPKRDDILAIGVEL